MTADRDLEKRALRNVRALVDKLERSDPPGSEWPLIRICGAALLALILTMLAVTWVKKRVESPIRERHACEVDAFAKRSAERELELRQTRGDLKYPEIRRMLERESPFTRAQARTDCDPAYAK